mmetsp:Transcript_16115/g.19083  ORF Transcript_16115/g.19083 Transcript_16115/m.19083 type:complete len:122 (+) Transcript_16115:99-464(+)|eukprot:CAMPEP_0198260286 /NCGR_PEP_ID=MMETSP1447-20131203/9299_1 /TAXON_ID=420782 /ORGANISM="Chaetoceros dichaeta, Strain CCMP1751" /LENGTH=121 /DNA_ID=CAMNT_0043947913 /DNA_START=61 /DNA_END=426 /DNA_ORIENTATION=-
MSSTENNGKDAESPYVMVNDVQMVPESSNPQNGNENELTFTRHPMLLDACPSCSKQVTTSINTHFALSTWAAVVVLAICFWPLFWVPLVVTSAKKTDHFCPQCDAKVGTVAPFSDCCADKS